MSWLGLRNVGLLGGLGGAIPLFDDFDRPNSTDLGATSVGNRPWQQWSGTWDISNNRIRNLTGTNPVAVVDAKTPDVNILLDVSSTGRDAIIFRASDANNWWRLGNYFAQSSYQQCNPDVSVYWFRNECEFYNTSTQQYCYCSLSRCGQCPSDCPQQCCGTTLRSMPPFCWQDSSVCRTDPGDCWWVTDTYRSVYLHRMQNGSLSQIGVWNVATTSRLRVIAQGNSISVYSNTGDTLRNTRTETFNNNATWHGVGRTQIGNTGTAMDNFTLTPL